MKLIDVLLLVVVVSLLTIGVHQSYHFGFAASYWLYMLALGAWFYYVYRKNNSAK